LVSMTIILPPEPDLIVLNVQQAVVRDGHAVRVAAHVIENLQRSGERAISVHYPLRLLRPVQPPNKATTFTNLLQSAKELQFAGRESFLQRFQEETTEQAGQNPHRQEEARRAGDPPLAVG